MELEMKIKIAIREVIAECSDWVRMDKTTWFEVEDMIKNKISDVLKQEGKTTPLLHYIDFSTGECDYMKDGDGGTIYAKDITCKYCRKRFALKQEGVKW